MRSQPIDIVRQSRKDQADNQHHPSASSSTATRALPPSFPTPSHNNLKPSLTYASIDSAISLSTSTVARRDSATTVDSTSTCVSGPLSLLSLAGSGTSFCSSTGSPSAASLAKSRWSYASSEGADYDDVEAPVAPDLCEVDEDLAPCATTTLAQQPELLQHIVGYLPRSALYTCRQVSHLFCHVASRALFGTVVVRGRAKLEAFQRAVISSSTRTDTNNDVRPLQTASEASFHRDWLTYIHRLEFSGTSTVRSPALSDTLLMAIATRCTHLKRLTIAGCRHITDKGVSAVLVQRALTLQTLDVCGCEQLTDASFMPLLQGDEEGGEASTGIDWSVATALPGSACACESQSHTSSTRPPLALRHVLAENVPQLNGATLLVLAHRCRSLHTLRLSFAKSIRGPAVTTILTHQPHLHTLSLVSCGKMTDMDLQRWQSCAYRLKDLQLECNYGKVTADALIALVERLAWCRLERLRVGGALELEGKAWVRRLVFAGGDETLRELRRRFPRVRIEQVESATTA